MGEVVQNHNAINHVGKNGSEWAPLDGDGDDTTTGATTDGALHADDAGRAAKASTKREWENCAASITAP
jgi:hypothetical protein